MEQLTNTQHFTAYGEAINSLWKKAKANQDRIQTIYDTEKPHTLSNEAVEQLTKEQQEGQKQLDIYDAKLKKFDEQLKLIEGILSKEKEQDQARQKVQELTIIISGDEYKNNKSLYSDWDATTSVTSWLTSREQGVTNRLQKKAYRSCKINSIPSHLTS